MKIRLDYVTNSSATGYIVCVPRHYKPTDDEIKKALSGSYNDYEEDQEDEIILGVNQMIEEIHRGVEVWQYETDGEIFYTLTALLDQFQLGAFEIHSDGDGMILPITPQKIEEIFLENHKINLKEIMEGGESVTTENKQK